MSTLDRVKFTAASGGTGAFVVSAAVTGWLTPAGSGMANAQILSYVAFSSDQTQWEFGNSTYTVSGTSIARSPTNSSTGGGAVSFTSPPTVAIGMVSDGIVWSMKFVDTTAAGMGIYISTTPFLHAYPTTANGNVFVGGGGNLSTVTGTNNFAAGAGALQNLSGGSSNFALGGSALTSLTTTNDNVAIGASTLSFSAQSNDIAIGFSAGKGSGAGAGSGGNNVFIGWSCGIVVNGGSYNTCIGLSAAGSLAGGALNTLVGYNAGSSITSGNNNTLIGSWAGSAALASVIALSDGAGNVRLDYGNSTAGCWTASGPVIVPSYAIGSLPSAAQGALAFTTDQLTTPAAKGVAPTAGGSVKCLVVYNGSGWVGA